jgi:hypothetical protein
LKVTKSKSPVVNILKVDEVNSPINSGDNILKVIKTKTIQKDSIHPILQKKVIGSNNKQLNSKKLKKFVSPSDDNKVIKPVDLSVARLPVKITQETDTKFYKKKPSIYKKGNKNNNSDYCLEDTNEEAIKNLYEGDNEYSDFDTKLPAQLITKTFKVQKKMWITLTK